MCQVSLYYPEKCWNSWCHKVPNMCIVVYQKGTNTICHNSAKTKNIKCASTVHGRHMCQVSLQYVENCRSSLTNKYPLLLCNKPTGRPTNHPFADSYYLPPHPTNFVCGVQHTNKENRVSTLIRCWKARTESKLGTSFGKIKRVLWTIQRLIFWTVTCTRTTRC